MTSTSPAPADDPRIASVLTFWLGATPPTDASALAQQKIWFTKSDALDDDIRQRFGPLIAQARAGQLDAGPCGAVRVPGTAGRSA